MALHRRRRGETIAQERSRLRVKPKTGPTRTGRGGEKPRTGPSAGPRPPRVRPGTRPAPPTRQGGAPRTAPLRPRGKGSVPEQRKRAQLAAERRRTKSVPEQRKEAQRKAEATRRKGKKLPTGPHIDTDIHPRTVKPGDLRRKQKPKRGGPRGPATNPGGPGKKPTSFGRRKRPVGPLPGSSLEGKPRSGFRPGPGFPTGDRLKKLRRARRR